MSESIGLAQLPLLPYHAVIFTSRRTPGDHGYGAMADATVVRGWVGRGQRQALIHVNFPAKKATSEEKSSLPGS